MGLLSKFIGRSARVTRAPRRSAVESMEARQLLAADVLLGSVYFEESLSGRDDNGDVLQVSFVGGAEGTTLDRLVIDGDKNLLDANPSANDVFFDTLDGGAGAFEAVGLSVQPDDGFQVESVEVVDGGTSIAFNLIGFEAGEELVFTIDVDEYGESRGQLNSNAFAEGGEFEGSTLRGEFSAPGFVDLSLEGTFYDAFDPDFDAAEAAAGATLDRLPGDDYGDPGDPEVPVRTAGAVAYAPQIELARLSGYVYHDRSDDGVRDAGEEGIGGVTLELLDASGVGTGVTTVTDASGFYQFVDLEAGVWGVRETQPDGFFDGQDTIGSNGGVAGNDVLTGATLEWGDRATEYNFGELLAASIAGRVHASTDGDCDFDDPDLLLAGVTIELLNRQGELVSTTTTDQAGRYAFAGLRPGEYQVRQTQPQGYYDGSERAGTAGGDVADDLISRIVVGSQEQATGYDFCEHVGANLSGYVYHDRSSDGVKDPGEEGIAGAEVKLLAADGTTVQTTTTDASGFYRFTNLDRGEYRVMEIQPEGWLDGLDAPGTHGGVADNPGDMIRDVTLEYGDDAQEYNFGEVLPGSIAGRVHASTDPDCFDDDSAAPIAGVVIELLDADGAVLRATTTDSDGRYVFDGLPPGEYAIRETQPDGYLDGRERAGTAGGVVSDDLVTGILLGSDVTAINYDFCEHVGASLSGYVYHDRSDDGVRNAGEEGIEGVTLELLDASGVGTGVTTVTDAAGFYQFVDLEAGVWGVRETQPDGFFDGQDTIGSNGGVAGNDVLTGATLEWGDLATEYNFGEILLGSIGGFVHASADPDCVDDGSAEPIAGVVIELLDADGAVLRTTTTNAEGRYLFDGLRPGEYAIRETQPAGYFDGGEHLGTAGGTALDDLFVGVAIGSGEDATGYHFCETPPADLSGFVFIDGAPVLSINGSLPDNLFEIRDGLRTADDTPLAGVTLRLVNGATGLPFYQLQPGETEDDAPDGFAAIETLPGTYPGGVFETVTDANGHYEFLSLPSGSYAVVQVNPDGLIDWIDTPGSSGGSAINPDVPSDPGLIPVTPFETRFGADVIFGVTLAAGDHSVENNFSELDTTTPVIFTPEDPETPPPFVPRAVITPGRPLLLPPVIQPEEETFLGFDGSGDVVGWTWHLSVINAGQPRTAIETGPATRFTSAKSDDTWRDVDRDAAELRRAKWRLLASDIEGAELNEAFFGSEEAIPVAGDWDGDGVAEIGVFLAGEWLLDLDGDGRWSKGDLWARLGSRDDLPVTGDWDGDGKTDIGVFGPAWPRDPYAIEQEPGLPDATNWPGPIAGKPKNVPPSEEDATSGARLLSRRTVETRRADVIDHVFHYGVAGDAPVAGDFNGDGVRTIGVFNNGVWNIDSNGDGRLNEDDAQLKLGQPGDVPIVGDWDGDGRDDLGVRRGGAWLADTDRDGKLEELRFAAADEALADESATPVVGDWDGDGRDEPAVYKHADAAAAPEAEVRVAERKAG